MRYSERTILLGEGTCFTERELTPGWSLLNVSSVLVNSFGEISMILGSFLVGSLLAPTHGLG